MEYMITYIIFIFLNFVYISRGNYLSFKEEKSGSKMSVADSHKFYGKSKRIGVKSYSPGMLVEGIDAKGNIPRRYCDRVNPKSCWKESLSVVTLWRRCLSHGCIRKNRIVRRDLLRRDMARYPGTDVRIYRSMDDKKVTDKPQGVAAPTFEDDGDERKMEKNRVRWAHANEVPNIAENQEVARNKGAHGEVNNNGKRMKETGSTFSDKRISSVIFGNEMVRNRMGTDGQDDPPEFLEKLENVFSLFGDYILAIMLKNLKLRLRQGNIAEVYQKRIEQVTMENGGNTMEAAKMLEGQIRDEFGESFQVKIDRYLKSLVDHIELP